MIENVLAEIKETILLYLPDQLKAQEAAFDDGIMVKMPRTEAVLIGGRKISEPPPCIHVTPVTSNDDHYASSKKDVEHTVDLNVIVSDTKEERAYQKLFRTVRALENVFEVQFKSGGEYVISYRTDSANYDGDFFVLSNDSSVAKVGTLTGTFKERVDAYSATQI